MEVVKIEKLNIAVKEKWYDHEIIKSRAVEFALSLRRGPCERWNS